MIHLTYRHEDGDNHVTWWYPQKGDKRPDTAFLKLEEVLQIDVSDLDRQFVKKNLPGLPMANHRPYTRYQGDLAKFVWDNL